MAHINLSTDFNLYSRFRGLVENSADPDQLASSEASYSATR